MAEEGPRTLTEAEAVAEIQFAMHMRFRHIKMGRVRFDELMLAYGLDWFGRAVAEQLRLSGITLRKRPPADHHASFPPREK